MGDRTIVHATEEDDDLQVAYHLVVTRSPLGAPGGFVSVCRVQEGGDEDELTITLEDLRVLQPALDWANGLAEVGR